MINQPLIGETATLAHPLLRSLEAAGRRLRSRLTAIDTALARTPYPFPHAVANATVATYLGAREQPPADDEGLWQAVDGYLDRSVTLYCELLGRLAARALDIERAVGGEATAPVAHA